MVKQQQNMFLLVGAVVCIGAGLLYYRHQQKQEIAGVEEPIEAIQIEESNVPKQEEPASVTTQQELDQLMQGGKPLAVKVFATWCPPCGRLKPIFKQVAQELADTMAFAEINYDEFEGKDALAIDSFPTIIFYKNGKEVTRLKGYREKEILKQELQQLM